ncbi:hypothetical protein BUQ74_08445 [Leptospira weilii serovar Heyan]|nr:hypothetical protein BUQ74_08445 [Leptospira weilii serovar Heyan]
MNSVNLFLKCGNYNKLRFYEQILKVGTSTFRKFFSFSYAGLTLNYICAIFQRVILIYQKNQAVYS